MTTDEKIRTPGRFVRARGRRGTFRVMRADDQGVTVYGGSKTRRQFHTFEPDRLKPAPPPPWAKESRT